MKVWSESFDDGGPIPVRYAFGKTSAEGKIDLSDNKNPHLAWSDVPSATKSMVILCIDSDAPTQPDDVNQEGRVVPADLPRTDFTHWVLADVKPEASIGEGEFSDGITPGGKQAAKGPAGTRQGINDYTSWFAGDPEMAGDYYGYDGPCPPFNDSLVHRYRFTVYALDLDKLPVDGPLTSPTVLDAIEGHVLAEASIVGRYAINPDAQDS